MSVFDAAIASFRKMLQTSFAVVVVDDLSTGKNGTGTTTGLDGDDLDFELARHYPLFSRPPAGSKGLVLKFWGLAIAVSYCDPGHEPRDLEAGEAQLETDSGAKLKMTKDGKLLLNGGGRGVARKDDTTNCGTLTGTVLVAGAPVAVQFTYTPPGGAPIPASPTANLQGKINSASATVEADA